MHNRHNGRFRHFEASGNVLEKHSLGSECANDRDIFVGKSRAASAAFVEHVLSVIPVSAQEQMVGPYTRAVVAAVADAQFPRVTVREKPRETMHRNPAPACASHLPVPTIVTPTKPDPARPEVRHVQRDRAVPVDHIKKSLVKRRAARNVAAQPRAVISFLREYSVPALLESYATPVACYTHHVGTSNSGFGQAPGRVVATRGCSLSSTNRRS